MKRGGCEASAPLASSRPTVASRRRHCASAEAAQEKVEHLDLALRSHPVLIQDALRGQPVDEHYQLMSRQAHVAAVSQFAEVRCLLQMAAQPVAEPVELGVLQVPHRLIAECPAPETDLDLRLEVAPVI